MNGEQSPGEAAQPEDAGPAGDSGHDRQPAAGRTIPELHGYPASLDTKEVAEVLGISAPEVSTRLAARQWPGFRIGVAWRVRRSVLQRLMLSEDPWQDSGAPEPESTPGDLVDVIPDLRGYPPSLSTRDAAEVLNIINQAEVSSRLVAGEWPGFRVGIQWRMRRSVVQAIMLGDDPWQGRPRRPNLPRNRSPTHPPAADN